MRERERERERERADRSSDERKNLPYERYKRTLVTVLTPLFIHLLNDCCGILLDGGSIM